MDLETRGTYELTGLELRQDGRELVGSFPYRGNIATIASTGRVRKERFEPRAFSYAVKAADREVHLLAGHSYGTPLASKQRGSLELVDTDEALSFRAMLPPEGEQPSWMVDTVRAMRAGLVGGISPGFTVPPASAVPDAEGLEPEPGNPGIAIRVIRAAVLFELSLVTRPAYSATAVTLRELQDGAPLRRPTLEERTRLWL